MTDRLRPDKLPEFLEAAYALELDDESWLRGVAAAAREVWGRGGSTLSGFYDASDPKNFRPTLMVTEGVSDELAAAFYGSLRYASPELIARLYRRCLAGTLRVVAPELEPSLAETTPLGVVDSMGFFGTEPDGLDAPAELGAWPRPLRRRAREPGPRACAADAH